jgi:Frataxin-like domain
MLQRSLARISRINIPENTRPSKSTLPLSTQFSVNHAQKRHLNGSVKFFARNQAGVLLAHHFPRQGCYLPSSAESRRYFESEFAYHQVADETLEDILDAVETALEDHTPNDAYEVVYASGVLTMTLPPHGTWVLNKQTPNRVSKHLFHSGTAFWLLKVSFLTPFAFLKKSSTSSTSKFGGRHHSVGHGDTNTKMENGSLLVTSPILSR